MTFMDVYHFTVNDHDEHCKKAAEILQWEKLREIKFYEKVETS